MDEILLSLQLDSDIETNHIAKCGMPEDKYRP